MVFEFPIIYLKYDLESMIYKYFPASGINIFFSFSIFATSDVNSIVVFVRLLHTGNRQFQSTIVNELDGLYLDVTCRFTSCWAFGDASGA